MVYVDLGKVLHIVSQGTCVVSSFFFFLLKTYCLVRERKDCLLPQGKSTEHIHRLLLNYLKQND